MRIRRFAQSGRVAVASAVYLSLCIATFGQSDYGSITGFIRDPSGAVVPNANVTLTREATKTERKTITNESGYYTVTNLPPGLYTMSAEASGFKKFEVTHNKLDPSATLAIDGSLVVGASTETVEVTSTTPPLQSESAAVEKQVSRQQIDALELNGRNPIFMAQLVPGTRGGNLASLNFNFSQGPSQINGARTPESLITYDGASAVRTRSNGTSIGAADVDSTSEIQVLTADYAAEYGRSSGGQIRIVTKSGGTDFHGAAYEYVRNTDFNANTWQRNANPATAGITAPIHYNQFGYNVGGPFYIPGKFNKDKSKFFWYWAQEWVKYHFTDQSLLLVPSLAMRSGDFSELLNPNNIYYGKAVQLKDPVTGAAIPGNKFSPAQLSPNGLGLLKAYPAPNLVTPINGDNWFFSAIHPQDQRKDTLAVDMNLTDKQRLTFRRNNFEFSEYQPLDGGSNETPKFFHRPNQTNALNYVWTISPNLVNEALATVSLDDVYIPIDAPHFLNRNSVGIDYPYIFPTGKALATRIPTIVMAPFSTLNGGPYPSHSAGPIYDASDSLTWIKGNHTMKFGALYERSGENDNDEINVQAVAGSTNNQNGQFQFTDSRSGQPTTGAGVGNAALGLFDTYRELGPRAYTIFRGSMTEAFARTE